MQHTFGGDGKATAQPSYALYINFSKFSIKDNNKLTLKRVVYLDSPIKIKNSI